MHCCAREHAERRIGAGATSCPYTAGLVTRRPLGCLFEIVETLVLTLIIFFVIQTFVAQPYRVEQQSMERTLEPDQYVLVDKLTPRFDDYSRGDIIVFEPPEAWAEGGPATPFIKRVIGLPGETIEIQDGEVLVDGTPLDEPYLYDLQPTTAVEEPASWVIPEGELFVMGDHRAASADSRAFGPISRDKVIGRAWVRYWPISAVGILPTPQYPPPVGNGDARPSPAVP
jgi:signal peptidase I